MAREVLGEEPREVGEKIQDWEEPLTCPQPLTKARMEVSMPTFTLAFKCAPLGRGEAAIRREMVADLAAEERIIGGVHAHASCSFRMGSIMDRQHRSCRTVSRKKSSMSSFSMVS